MINVEMPQVETTILAQHAGIDFDELESECEMGDIEVELEIDKAEKTKQQYRNMQHNAMFRCWGWTD